MSGPIQPADKSWIVAIHRSGHDQEPIGTGVVIGADLVLTCSHVLDAGGVKLTEAWVSFPMSKTYSAGLHRLRATRIDHASLDAALIQLESATPPSVRPAPLRTAVDEELVGREWWAFGFPHKDGSLAEGRVTSSLTTGTLLLDTASAKTKLMKGFSGGPLWSPDYQAVVGLVTQASSVGDGFALALHWINEAAPQFGIGARAAWRVSDVEDTALAAWGWLLRDDPQLGRHWSPRGRGVSVESEAGYRFRGREAVLRKINQWFAAPKQNRRILVITGSPGAGKSALLGRVVTTADPEIRKALPQGGGVFAAEGSVDCAVHAKGKTALDVAEEIARSVSIALPDRAERLAPAFRKRLGRARFNLVVDALDEAASVGSARELIDDVLVPLAEAGATVVVGTRRADGKGDLVGRFGAASMVVDLDSHDYFSEADLVEYAYATLCREGVEVGADHPYANRAVARQVAVRIAALAERNFLVAGLVAGAHGNFDVEPVSPAAVAFPPTVDSALNAYVYRLPPAGMVPASLVLTVLAYAEAPGLPLSLWRAGIAAFGGHVTEDQLQVFARGSAANFLVEIGLELEPVYRLFHQALNESLMSADRAENETKLVRAWLKHGADTDWKSTYLTERLPAHADRGRCVDLLLADAAFLLHADLRRLLPVAEHARDQLARARARLLQRTPKAAGVVGARRAAMFSVVEQLDHLDSRMPAHADATYRSIWARTPPRSERAVLEGHTDAVLGVCTLRVDGRSLLASGGGDFTVRIWDPVTGQMEQTLDLHTDAVRAVCGIRVDEDTLLATAGQDSTVLLWDPRTGKLERALHSPRSKERPFSHADWVRALCAVPVSAGRDLLASASDDRSVRLWDPATGDCARELRGHSGWVTALCSVSTDRGTLLASAGYDGTVRIWDPHSGTLAHELIGHLGWVTALCAVSYGPHRLLASAGYDDVVRLWDPVTGAQVRAVDTVSVPVTGMCEVTVSGLTMLAVAGEDGVIRLYNPSTGRGHRTFGADETAIHTDRVRGVCTVSVGRRPLLASASDDGTVRLWDPSTGRAEIAMDGGRVGPVLRVCELDPMDAVDGARAVATTSLDGSVRVWNAQTGDPLREPLMHRGGVTDVCSVTLDDRRILAVATADPIVRLWDLQAAEFRHGLDAGAVVNVLAPISTGRRQLLATAGEDELIRLWNPISASQDVVLHGPMNSVVTAICPVPGDGGYDLLASATDDGTVQLWDPTDSTSIWVRHGHAGQVTALRSVTVNGRRVLASASADRSIRLWDPASGEPLKFLLRGHAKGVNDLCAMPGDDGDLLVSASDDRTVRIWDPETGGLIESIPVHHPALSCQWVDGQLIIGLRAGVLALSVASGSGSVAM
ncbi:trypsin-like peptidase domain-containing protein [Dactylosporangium sp. NPDC050588]|uniref:trypsin-like peptidase domain-containing protein n=1 Tax=Dactylosporangium sp. NPDC050588 TaxID=3157211 RepID=UPI0033E2D442